MCDSAVNWSPEILVSCHEGGPGATEVGGEYGGGEKGRRGEDDKASKQARGGVCDQRRGTWQEGSPPVFRGLPHLSQNDLHLCTIQTNLKFILRAPAACAKVEVEIMTILIGC